STTVITSTTSASASAKASASASAIPSASAGVNRTECQLIPPNSSGIEFSSQPRSSQPKSCIRIDFCRRGPTDQVLAVSQYDNRIVYKSSLSSPSWSPLGNPAQVLDLVQWPDYSILAVFNDNTLRLCPSVSFWYSCTLLANSGALKSIDLMADKKTLVGVGMDGLLYTRNGINGVWSIVPNSGTVIDITVLANGVLLGTAPDNNLYTKQTLTAPWVYLGLCCVTRTAGLSDGSILGVGLNNALYKMSSLGASWVFIPNSGSVVSDKAPYAKKISALSDGWQHFFYVIGTDNILYSCSSLLHRSIDMTANSPWQLVPWATNFVDVTVMPNGAVLATGLDGQVWTKRKIWLGYPDASWVLVAQGCCVVRTQTLDAPWVLIPNTGSKLYSR
ncbi:hypothetical protein BCR33DRAFT_714799, partial [Rhizoclosmatium globosum]